MELNLRLAYYVATVRTESVLAAALMEAGEGDQPFTHAFAVAGHDRSVRIMSQFPMPGGVPLPRPMSAQEVARELFELARTEARYPPTSKPTHTQKGYEVRCLHVDGKRAAVMLAEWVE